LLGRDIEDIVAVMNGDKTKHNDRDADLPDISNTWRLNEIYANKPPEERYASIKRFVSEQANLEDYPEPEPIKQPPPQEVKLANPDKVNAKDAQVEQQAHAEPKPVARAERSKPTLDRERQRIIDALTTANLLGMGGAGGRAYKKWTDVNDAKGDVKYVVCNGDESEPGTFKDREILLRTPHLVVEAMTLAGLFLKAERGYIYIRHEFEEQIAACRAEIERAKKMGVLGNNILGSGMSFQLEVFVSPGGYICGEQTALIQAIQDQRAEPRNRPPDLQTNGLWDKPTLVNNVETFAWVPSIVERDNGKWFAGQSTRPPTAFPPDSNKESFLRGARFFSVSGDVNKPAAVEVPIGIKIKDLIAKCGGMKGGKKLLAIALSGPSGGFIPAKLPRAMFPTRTKDRAGRELLPPGDGDVDVGELELDIDLFRQWNIMMGAGIIVYAEGTNLIDQAVACLKFYKRETCGKCVPCRIGSTRMTEWGQQIQSKQATLVDIERFNSPTGPVQELALTMRSTAICGLGSIAFMPLTTLLKYFPDQIANHLKS
jgi:NADH:ubiquinone oxidoreductase subunit F (NADH-binding)